MEIISDPESPCLDKFQREAFLCLNTFPEKVTELNNLIDEYTPEAVKKNRGNVKRQTAPSCLSINSTSPDYYFHDVGSCYSATTYRDRCKSRNGICKKKFHPYLRRRSRPLAQILAILVNRLAVCTQTVFIKPSKYLIDSVAAMFPHREQLRHVQCGTSTVWKTRYFDENCGIVNNLICTMRPAAVRLIADTTILKRWLQALALAGPISPNQSLAQAIRTTETIDGWAYELFFHLKYLQVVNFPCESDKDRGRGLNEKELTEKTEPVGHLTIFSESDDVLHTNLWHRIVQLRDHYVILFETLRSNGQFLDSDETKNVCPIPD